MFGKDKEGILVKCGNAIMGKKMTLITTSLGSRAGDKMRVMMAFM